MLTTLTPTYSEAFITECLKNGLTVKQAGVLLWRQRMDEAMERPMFRDAFNEALVKTSATKPSIFDQVDAALADKGSAGANMAHYGGRGAGLGGTVVLLGSLLGGRKGLAKGIGRAIKGTVGGIGLGGLAGAGYGAHKSIRNRFNIDARALNLGTNPQAGPAIPSSAPSGDIDIYSRDGLRFGPQSTGTAGGAMAATQRPGAASDYVRQQQVSIDASDKKIRDLEQSKSTFPRTGNPAADYAQERTINESIAAEQKARNERQKAMGSSLHSLKQQQQYMNDRIDSELPYAKEREQYFSRMGDAADQVRSNNWLARKLLGWIGGETPEQDPVWNYKIMQGRAQAARQNMENSVTNPPLYR